MEDTSSATGNGHLPGYPVTAIPLPERRSGGLLARLYVARVKAAATATALLLAGAGFVFLPSSFMKEVPSLPPAERPAASVALETDGPNPAEAVAAPAASKESAEAPKPDPATKLREDRLASLEKAAAKMEAMLAKAEKPKEPPAEIPRAEIKVTSAERSGFWRFSGKDEENFVIVEAVGDDGRPMTMPVTDMDTGETRQVSRWAVRVTPEEFARLSAEKAVSGGIGGMLAGVRDEGAGAIDWKLDVEGDALVEWKEDGQ